jgi:hypothetical protein
MHNRVFFPQAALDEWITNGTIDLHGTELTILAEGRRYRLVEAVHVLREVTGTPDLHELVGRVKSRAFLEELGAELVETSMLLGDCAFDVAPGWLGAPVGSFDEHLSAATKAQPMRPVAKTDEDLLARFLGKNL